MRVRGWFIAVERDSLSDLSWGKGTATTRDALAFQQDGYRLAVDTKSAGQLIDGLAGLVAGHHLRGLRPVETALNLLGSPNNRDQRSRRSGSE
jgi:hypothetical protein